MTTEKRGHTFIDLKGERFGRWLVLEVSHSSHSGIYWRCLCDCGQIRVVSGMALRNGESQSHGCLRRELKTKHGHAGYNNPKTGSHRDATKEYAAWVNAKQRMVNSKNKRFHCNGAKGKTMCDGWLNDYAAFFGVLGKCPPGLSLHRINNKLGYTCGQCDECKANGWPMNCKWDTAIAQANEKSTSRFMEFRGKRLTIAEWGRFAAINPQYIYTGLRKGWTPEEIIIRYLPLTSPDFRLWFAQAESPQ